uniref:Protein phosphatase 1 regulatory subunit 35 c-terminus n=1 Tax=Culex tarsalis TaxID=7177 RepID=A0A1Q3EWS4_CULTA
MAEKPKCKYRKAFLRDVDIPLATSNARVLKPTSGSNQQQQPKQTKSILKRTSLAPSTATAPAPSNKFKQPELHTALNVQKQIEKVQNVKAKAPASIGELTPKSQKFVRNQITRKLNFQQDDNVFKGLVPVNVNDSVLIPARKRPLRSKFVAKEKRDPEPELADFLRPIPKCSIEFEPYLPPEPVPRRPNFDNFAHIMDVFGKIDVGA